MSKFFYGFKNKETGLFKNNYYTGHAKHLAHVCCFRSKNKAEEILKDNEYKDQYTVEVICEIEK